MNTVSCIGESGFWSQTLDVNLTLSLTVVIWDKLINLLEPQLHLLSNGNNNYTQLHQIICC